MGMIECFMRKVPDSQTAVKYMNTVARNIDRNESEKEGYEVRTLKPEDFDWAWDAQDNLKKEADIREKYKLLTDQGRVIFVEIDW